MNLVLDFFDYKFAHQVALKCIFLTFYYRSRCLAALSVPHSTQSIFLKFIADLVDLNMSRRFLFTHTVNNLKKPKNKGFFHFYKRSPLGGVELEDQNIGLENPA